MRGTANGPPNYRSEELGGIATRASGDETGREAPGEFGDWAPLGWLPAGNANSKLGASGAMLVRMTVGMIAD